MAETATNKVQYGFKNVGITPITGYTNGVPTYSSRIPVPGAVNFSMSGEGGKQAFSADDDPNYFVTYANNGFSGTLEMARFPEAVKEAIWGHKVATGNGVHYEDADAAPVEFALDFEIQGDSVPTRYCMYRVSGSRPVASHRTKGENVEPDTESSEITAAKATFANDISTAMGYAIQGETAYDQWHKAVQVPTVKATGSGN